MHGLGHDNLELLDGLQDGLHATTRVDVMQPRRAADCAQVEPLPGGPRGRAEMRHKSQRVPAPRGGLDQRAHERGRVGDGAIRRQTQRVGCESMARARSRFSTAHRAPAGGHDGSRPEISLRGACALAASDRDRSRGPLCGRSGAAGVFVARRTRDAEELYDIVALDPDTGTAGSQIVFHGSVDDLAVHPDGTRILVAAGRSVRELDLEGHELATFGSTFVPRSVAYDPRGGILMAGTGDSYVVGHHDGRQFTVVTQSDAELLSLVRPRHGAARS